MNLKFDDFARDFREVKASRLLPRRASALTVRHISKIGYNMNYKMLFLLCSCTFLFQCDRNNPPLFNEQEINLGDYEIEMTGILRVLLPEDCVIEYCGPKYSLLNDTLWTEAILIGDIDKNHSNLIIQVFGKEIILTDDDRILINYFGPIDTAIYVEKYRLISSIEYHSFLVYKAREYTIKKYGCYIAWEKTFSWKIIEDTPYIIVRMTDTFSDCIPLPFIELWYHGDSGKFIKEINSLGGIDPCEE